MTTKTKPFEVTNVDKEREFINRYPQRKNLLESLCDTFCVQGGTIHQYCDITAPNYDKFVSEFNFFCVEMSFVCNTKRAFKKLAARVNYAGLKF